jgi:hypothetical protein
MKYYIFITLFTLICTNLLRRRTRGGIYPNRKILFSSQMYDLLGRGQGQPEIHAKDLEALLIINPNNNGFLLDFYLLFDKKIGAKAFLPTQRTVDVIDGLVNSNLYDIFEFINMICTEGIQRCFMLDELKLGEVNEYKLLKLKNKEKKGYEAAFTYKPNAEEGSKFINICQFKNKYKLLRNKQVINDLVQILLTNDNLNFDELVKVIGLLLTSHSSDLKSQKLGETIYQELVKEEYFKYRIHTIIKEMNLVLPNNVNEKLESDKIILNKIISNLEVELKNQPSQAKSIAADFLPYFDKLIDQIMNDFDGQNAIGIVKNYLINYYSKWLSFSSFETRRNDVKLNAFLINLLNVKFNKFNPNNSQNEGMVSHALENSLGEFVKSYEEDFAAKLPEYKRDLNYEYVFAHFDHFNIVLREIAIPKLKEVSVALNE